MNERRPHERRCNGTNKAGGPCGRPPIRGGNVCPRHGGGAPQVRAKANERLLADAAIKEFGLAAARDPERVLAELGCLAYARLGDLFDGEGKFIPVHKLPPHIQAVVASSKVRRVNLEAGDGQTDEVVEVKVWDKWRALEMLAKHHGLMEEKVQHSGEVTFRWEGEGKK